jgi:hypothetical protein
MELSNSEISIQREAPLTVPFMISESRSHRLSGGAILLAAAHRQVKAADF